MKRLTIPDLMKKANAGERLVVLTAYDATFAKLIDAVGVDLILVGDSLGMVVQGHTSTLPVTLDDVIYHTACVTRAVPNAPVVADLPFMSYQASSTQALLAAGRAMKEGGADAIKLEGGFEMTQTVELMTAAGVPVMAHIGLKPQRVKAMGGYKIQGKTVVDARRLVEEAQAMEQAGAFSIVLEGIAVETAKEITEAVHIPTIGISSGPFCRGQVLVINDLLGLDPGFAPRFAKRYANLHEIIQSAVNSYKTEVKQGTFPTQAHAFPRVDTLK